MKRLRKLLNEIPAGEAFALATIAYRKYFKEISAWDSRTFVQRIADRLKHRHEPVCEPIPLREGVGLFEQVIPGRFPEHAGQTTRSVVRPHTTHFAPTASEAGCDCYPLDARND
jgi:hypothetical protein